MDDMRHFQARNRSLRGESGRVAFNPYIEARIADSKLRAGATLPEQEFLSAFDIDGLNADEMTADAHRDNKKIGFLFRPIHQPFGVRETLGIEVGMFFVATLSEDALRLFCGLALLLDSAPDASSLKDILKIKTCMLGDA